MAGTTVGVILNGVTGRMGYRQHLMRSILAIRDDGGLELSDGSRVQVEPLLVGRTEAKLAEIAARHGVAHYTTDLDGALADERWRVYFDTQVTQARALAIKKAISAGKDVYTEKPLAETYAEATELAELAAAAGIRNGVVHDKLFLPGLVKLRRLIDSGFFGRILSVRGEFGYWVFEGDWMPAQRPSWNYRAEDGGGIVADMFCHWNYVLENLFGRVEHVYAQAVTHIPSRVDERGAGYQATADDAAYAVFGLAGGVVAQLNSSWTTRVHRRELVEFQVDGTLGSAVAGLFDCRVQPRVATPRPTWNPDVPETHDYLADWLPVPDGEPVRNGFRVQWEQFLRHVLEGGPYPYDFAAGARGVRLAEAGLTSSRTGRRVEL
ncbi:MAG TPA: Gfo/Idh/MocA family oxidoreductase [Mycobacteriales bacterium]|nr:Gfo/Idh/MocA family oxidoreductase [Mycobacteriales bacterium]